MISAWDDVMIGHVSLLILLYIYCTVLVTYTHLPFWRHSFKMESHLPNSFPAGITEV